MQIDHELAERPLEPRDLALGHDEARAGELGRRFEIHQAHGLAELEMLRRLAFARRAVAAPLDIISLVRAIWRLVSGQVGQSRERLMDFALDTALVGFERRCALLEGGDLRHQFLRPRLVLGSLGLADLLRARIARLLKSLQFADDASALVIERDDPGSGAGEALVAAHQRLIESIGVFADRADIVHGSSTRGRD